MPKIVTDAERKIVLEAIYQSTIALIKQKNIKNVTVSDITTSVGISKGAFYSYYPSREACLYEVLKHSEHGLFMRMETIMSQSLNNRERIEQFFREVFLAPDSIILYIAPTDIDVLLRKLPSEYSVREKKKSTNYFQRSLNLLKVSKSKMEVLALLTDCLQLVVTNDMFSEKGKQQALDVLIVAISNYLL